MLKVLAIVEPEIARGFKLSGVAIEAAQSAQLVKECLLKAMKDKNYGIIIIDSTHIDSFDEHTKRLIEDSSVPLIVPLPLEMRWKKESGGEADTYVGDMIRHAIGHHIKIK